MKLSLRLAKKLLVACPRQAVMIMGVTYLSGSFPHMQLPAQPHPCSESQSWRAAVCPHNVWSYAVLTRAEMSVNAFVFLIWSAQHYLFWSPLQRMHCTLWDGSASAMMRAREGLVCMQDPYCGSLSVSDRMKENNNNTPIHYGA